MRLAQSMRLLAVLFLIGALAGFPLGPTQVQARGLRRFPWRPQLSRRLWRGQFPARRLPSGGRAGAAPATGAPPATGARRRIRSPAPITLITPTTSTSTSTAAGVRTMAVAVGAQPRPELLPVPPWAQSWGPCQPAATRDREQSDVLL